MSYIQRFAATAQIRGSEVAHEPLRIGSAFQHHDGTIALYLDALPVTGRIVLTPELPLPSARPRGGA